MSDRFFDNAARDALVALYPETPGRIAHGLAGHPLMELDSLVRLAARIRPVDIERNKADLPIGVDPADLRDTGMTVAETIRRIEQNGSWMVLKFVDQDPEYRALLHAVLAEIEPVIQAATGAMLKREAFVFISSPGAMTPFHMDPEHNILMQCRGTKTMTVFPQGDRELAGPERHEAFHDGHHRNLPWQDDFAQRGTAFALAPGEAIYVPVKAPHFVRNGPEPSVSLSVTWRSEWSYREEQAHGFNAMLRRTGLDPAAPARFPRQNHAKSIAYRALARAGRMFGRDR